MVSAEEIIRHMGFPDTECGPFVTALRASVAKQVADGMTNRSGGTWAPGNHSYEDRAKALLAWDWELEHGHHYRVEAIDGFAWDNIPHWLGDKWRYSLMEIRAFINRKILRKINPYT